MKLIFVFLLSFVFGCDSFSFYPKENHHDTNRNNRKLSDRWGYDRNANPFYREYDSPEGVVVDDMRTETPKHVNRAFLKGGVNARVRPRGRNQQKNIPICQMPIARGPRARALTRVPCKSKHRLGVADNCFPNPELLVRDENLPDTRDVHVVVIDDPMVLIVDDCGEKRTTCSPEVKKSEDGKKPEVEKKEKPEVTTEEKKSEVKAEVKTEEGEDLF